MSTLNRRISINCGGTLSQISHSLLQAHPFTLLAKLTAGLPSASGVPSLATCDLFLDRDPASFAVVLNWYRYGKLLPPATLPAELLADDIVYFRLPLTSDAASKQQQPTTSREGSLTFTNPGMLRMHSQAIQQQQPGSSPTSLPMSRANSQFGNTNTGGEESSSGMPALSHQPSFVPQLSRVVSVPSPPDVDNYASLDCAETGGGTMGMEGGPSMQILHPSIPPIFATATSQSQAPRPFMTPLVIHNVGGGGATAAPGADAYLNLGAGDVSSSRSMDPVVILSPNSVPVPIAVLPTPIVAVAAPVVAAPAPVPIAAAPAPVVAAAPRPRCPFDLAIEMLSCFKDVNRQQALALLDTASVTKSPGGGGAYESAAISASASSPASEGDEEGSYLFRVCNDPDERAPDGSIPKDLFVLSYLKQRKMFNSKVWRHYLGVGAANVLGAPTVQGYVLSEEKVPMTKENMHTSILTLTHAIIGPHAKAIVIQ